MVSVMNNRTCPDRCEAGFTLVELLISMTLLALISVGLYESLRLGLHAWERGSSLAKDTDDIRTVQSTLRRAIADAYPYWIVQNATHANVDFEGRPDRIRLLAPAPRSLGHAGFARYEISALPENGNYSLEISAAHELAAESARPLREKLINHLTSIEFTYFGSGPDDDEAKWHGSWTNRRTLPRLVRVRASFPSGDTRQWPEMVIAPRITGDANCVYDALTKYCRGR